MVNIDADTLSCNPLDMDHYMSLCTEELSQEFVNAVWEGTRVTERKYVAWVTPPLILTCSPVNPYRRSDMMSCCKPKEKILQ